MGAPEDPQLYGLVMFGITISTRDSKVISRMDGGLCMVLKLLLLPLSVSRSLYLILVL